MYILCFVTTTNNNDPITQIKNEKEKINLHESLIITSDNQLDILDRKPFKRIETRSDATRQDTHASTLKRHVPNLRFDSRKPFLRTKNGCYREYVSGQLLVDCSGNRLQEDKKIDSEKKIGKILKDGD